MKNTKLDKFISLSPLAMAVLIPVGRYVFGKILKKQKAKQSKIDSTKQK